jgi:toxin ParE1/3/4
MTRNYRLSASAEEDIVSLTAYTLDYFGEEALDRYLGLIELALRELCRDPSRLGVREFENEVRKIPLRHFRNDAATEHGIVKNPRHVVYFEVAKDGSLEILRVLHDSMDEERQFDEK